MVLAILPYSSFDEEEEHNMLDDVHAPVFQRSTGSSYFTADVSAHHTDRERQVVADAPFAEEPESLWVSTSPRLSPSPTRMTSSPLPISPSPLPPSPSPHHSSSTPLPTSPFQSALLQSSPSPHSENAPGPSSPSRFRFPTGDSTASRRVTLSPQATNSRKNTRKSTSGTSLPPKLTPDETVRSFRKPTIKRALSISMVGATAPGRALDIEDSEALNSVWMIYAREAQQADRRMITNWNRSLDVRLLFSGIFSAILTPFIVESYKLLNHPGQPSPAFFSAEGYTVRVNAMWFGSLIVSLIAALLSIHCKQWLDAYLVDMHFETSASHASTLQYTCRLRQYRFQALQNFYISQVIGLLPVFLYIALVFFAAGLIDLLWFLNKGIAIYVSVLCGFVVLFYLATTIVPIFTTRTPYRTPLSDFLGNLWRGMLEGKICVRGKVELAERKDVEALGYKLDKKCFKWLQSNTESEGHMELALRAEHELQRIEDRELKEMRESMSNYGVFRV